MLRLEDLKAWLFAGGLAGQVELNSMPDKPDSVVILADTGGYGLEVEDAIDNPTVQVRCRGWPPAVRDLAHQVDRLMIGSARPFALGGQHVTDVGRVGGPPAFMEQDDRGRTTYTCNYRLGMER